MENRHWSFLPMPILTPQSRLALDANFYTAGEVCSNATRVFVEASIADDFIAAMVAKAQTMKVGEPDG